MQVSATTRTGYRQEIFPVLSSCTYGTVGQGYGSLLKSPTFYFLLREQNQLFLSIFTNLNVLVVASKISSVEIRGNQTKKIDTMQYISLIISCICYIFFHKKL